MSRTQEQDEEAGCGPCQLGARQNVRVLRVVAICLLYILLSASMIKFNKYLMRADRFPHAMALAAVQMLVGTVLSSALYGLAPSLFPGRAKVEGTGDHILYRLTPIAACFAVSIYAGNRAYGYSSVPFLQFMKEANVLIMFLISCAVGLQAMSRSRFIVIMWVLLGSGLCVTSELHFVLAGFLFQLLSQVADCLKAVLSEVLLAKDATLDPMTFTLLISPICLMVLLIGNVFAFNDTVLSDLKAWWHFVLPNALWAFALNVTNVLLLRETSAMGLVITGMCKDISLVLLSNIFWGDAIARMQWFSFCITLSGVAFWSLMKLEPDASLVLAFERSLGSRAWPTLNRKIDERSRLVSQRPPEEVPEAG